MSQNILIVAAHSDDETLGCGGVIAKHVDAGERVRVVVVADGVSSRSGSSACAAVQARNASFAAAMSVLGVSDIMSLEYPDNQLDTVPLLKIVKDIEHIAATFPANVVYTHFPEDLNIDHKITAEAVLTAFRPLPETVVQEVLLFEVMSSTGWGNSASNLAFNPNYFSDISDFLTLKMRALECYQDEMRGFPHARSADAILALAKFRGASVGLSAAEAFVLARKVLRRLG